MSRGKHVAVKTRKKRAGANRRTAQVVAAASLTGPVLMLTVAGGANAAELTTAAIQDASSTAPSIEAPLVPGEVGNHTAEPTELANPAEVVEPLPTEPVLPPEGPVVEPTDPVTPPEPVIQPTDPVDEPTDPVAPTEPVIQPTEPVVTPTEPVVPVDPAGPVVPLPSVKQPPPAGQPAAGVASQQWVPAAGAASAVHPQKTAVVPAAASGAKLANTGANENQMLIGVIGAGTVLAGVGAVAATRRSKGRHSL